MATAAPVKWYRCPVEKQVMSDLRARTDWQGFCQVMPHLLLITATGTAAFLAWWYKMPWPVIVAALFVHGTFFCFLGPGGAGHELSHKTVFKTVWLNEFFMKLTAFLTYTHYPLFRVSHVKHHQFTVHHDHDLEVVLPQKLRWWNWIEATLFSPLGIFNSFRTHIRLSLGILKGEWEKRIVPESDKKLKREIMNWSRTLLIGHLALAVVFIYFKLWILLAIVTFGTFYAGWLNMLMGFPQHAGMSPDVSDFRLCCRTFVANPFFNFLYWQMNYHAEHHMFPGVPCYNLKKLRKTIDADMPPANHGLWATWNEILTILRRQKQDPTYTYMPPLPNRSQTEMETSSAEEVLAEASGA